MIPFAGRLAFDLDLSLPVAPLSFCYHVLSVGRQLTSIIEKMCCFLDKCNSIFATFDLDKINNKMVSVIALFQLLRLVKILKQYQNTDYLVWRVNFINIKCGRDILNLCSENMYS